MTITERNKHLRELADEIARTTANIIGLCRAPKCIRITRNRGHGYGHQFSVPAWAAENTDYFTYYVIHETCHAIPDGRHHSPHFHAAEQKAMREFGLLPVYEKAGKGPYITELRAANSNETVFKRTW